MTLFASGRHKMCRFVAIGPKHRYFCTYASAYIEVLILSVLVKVLHDFVTYSGMKIWGSKNMP